VGKSARKIAAELGVSRTAYNNFAHGRVKTQDRVRRPIGLLYLRVPPELRKPEQQRTSPASRQQRVAEHRAGYGPGGLEDGLRRILSEDPAEARRQLLAALDDPGAPEGAVVRSVLLEWTDREYPPGEEDTEPPKTRKKK
jgi:transcriptional regulator with XRE-family HTH domain